jgi:AraC family transcriptional regulator
LNRYQLLLETADVSVNRFDHPPHEAHEDPEEELASRWAIAFVLAGSFEIEVKGKRRRLRRGSVLLTRPGLAFRFRHAEQCPTDVCLSIGFGPDAVSGIEHVWERPARESATPRLAYAERRMGGAIASADAFQMERWALAALTALEVDARDQTVRGRYAARDKDLDAVIAACRAVEAHPEMRCSVADRARDVGLTSTKLTRAFRRYVGASPHEYVLRWRLAVAAELVDSGVGVSETCYRAGFENLSHFCRTFQRTFGSRASAWRALPLRERRRRVEDLTGRLI